MKRDLLIVDDTPSMVELLADHFGSRGYRILKAESGADALEVLARESFEGVILLDYKLPDVEGVELIPRIVDVTPLSPIIIITAHGTIGMAMDAVVKGGAFYVHSKGEESFLERVSATVANAFGRLELSTQVISLQNQIGNRYSFDNIITQSREMKGIFRRLEQVMDSRVAVAIQGESGTGKELIARAVHYNSPRKDKPFVAVNCAGIPSTLLESEMFGYEKGAFTGAAGRKIGKFEQAHRGTLFLDEIGEMEPALQAKLLRVLQEKTFERLGGNETIQVDVRIITATNKDLSEEVKKGTFRQDLYYRLSVFPIRIPPLRERREDIPILASHFARKLASDEGREPRDITPRAMARLMACDYPGNVRQLENVISHAVVVSAGQSIDIGDLPEDFLRESSEHGRTAVSGEGTEHSLFGNEVIPLKVLEDMAIRHALSRTQGNVSLAARLLGVSRVTLHRHLRTEDQP